MSTTADSPPGERNFIQICTFFAYKFNFSFLVVANFCTCKAFIKPLPPLSNMYIHTTAQQLTAILLKTAMLRRKSKTYIRQDKIEQKSDVIIYCYIRIDIYIYRYII